MKNFTKNHILLSGLICSSLMSHQVCNLEKLFNYSCVIFPSLSREEFMQIINILMEEESSAITGISNGYIYQTISTIHKNMTFDEIFIYMKQ